MMIALGGDLGQMGHAEDLVIVGETVQQLSYNLGDTAPDTGIDFVEYIGRGVPVIFGYDLYSQADTGQLAAGGNFAHRLRGLARINGNQKFDDVVTMGLRDLVAGRRDLDDNPALGHTQLFELFGNSFTHVQGRPFTAVPQFL